MKSFLNHKKLSKNLFNVCSSPHGNERQKYMRDWMWCYKIYNGTVTQDNKAFLYRIIYMFIYKCMHYFLAKVSARSRCSRSIKGPENQSASTSLNFNEVSSRSDARCCAGFGRFRTLVLAPALLIRSASADFVMIAWSPDNSDSWKESGKCEFIFWANQQQNEAL